jgi:hypothetical protein
LIRRCIPVLVIGLLTLAAADANAQSLTGGAKIGINFSSLPNAGEVIDQVVKQPSSESSSKIGAVFGGFVTVPMTDRWAFQPELQFVVKGVTLTEAAGGGAVGASIRYLEFPVLARYRASVGAHTVHLFTGPTFAVKAGTSAQLDAPNQTVDENIDGAIRTFDVGIAFAAAVDYQRYFFEARYTQGLRDVATESFPHADALHNRAFAVAAGIHLK